MGTQVVKNRRADKHRAVIDAEIVASTVAPGMPSLRGHKVREKLAEAGFKPGYKVRVTVTERKP